jgi:very-short-patch-repair endonuclease
MPSPPAPLPHGRGENDTKLPSERNLQIRNARAVTIGRAKELRRYGTASEAVLWEQLRGRRLNGLKFRRQCPLGAFVVDFLCSEKSLVIELDGGYHDADDQQFYDEQRAKYLETDGFRILRFRNEDVLNNIHSVCAAILKAAHQEPLSREGEGQG